MDLILDGGTVITLDRRSTIAEALAASVNGAVPPWTTVAISEPRPAYGCGSSAASMASRSAMPPSSRPRSATALTPSWGRDECAARPRSSTSTTE